MEGNRPILTNKRYVIPFIIFFSAIICLACLVVLHTMKVAGKDNCATSYAHVEDSEISWMKIAIFTSATLSVCGTSFIIFSYYYFIALRTFPIKMIVMLSIADLFSSISYFIGFANHAKLCFAVMILHIC